MIRILLATFLTAGFLAVIILLVMSGGKEVEAIPLEIVQSSDCQSCHPEVYAEWKRSWHAMAWSDPFVRDKQQADLLEVQEIRSSGYTTTGVARQQIILSYEDKAKTTLLDAQLIENIDITPAGDVTESSIFKNRQISCFLLM